MASVGVNHYLGVESLVREHQLTAASDAGEEKLEDVISSLQEEFKNELALEREKMATAFGSFASKLSEVDARQNSHEAQMRRFDAEQTALIFKVETHDESFRPLRVQGSDFRKVETAGGNEYVPSHPLLPPADGW
ncbi:MAG: hypothetical protein Q7Q71_13145 [Verrucomicrobiota bacterium JB023]|nr:hypothetical protein [Verrucomicrobiota bacterium JB023]